MNNQHTAAIPNTLIETMFYESIKNYDDVLTYRNLVAKGSSQAIASATSLASRKVHDRLTELLDMEKQFMTQKDAEEGPSIYDHPEMLK
jgi:hypothetical protein